MLRHTFVTTMLDAGVDPRDVRTLLGTPTLGDHADDRARNNLDRHPTSWPRSWPQRPDDRTCRCAGGLCQLRSD